MCFIALKRQLKTNEWESRVHTWCWLELEIASHPHAIQKWKRFGFFFFFVAFARLHESTVTTTKRIDEEIPKPLSHKMPYFKFATARLLCRPEVKLLNGIVNVTISICTWFGQHMAAWRYHFHLKRVVKTSPRIWGRLMFVVCVQFSTKIFFELFPIAINQWKHPASCNLMFWARWFMPCACIHFNILLCKQLNRSSVCIKVQQITEYTDFNAIFNYLLEMV